MIFGTASFSHSHTKNIPLYVTYKQKIIQNWVWVIGDWGLGMGKN
jgi:hypothetical protein